MFTASLQIVCTICISLFIIYVGHALWNVLKDQFSIKKKKDLVNIQTEKYKKIIENIQKERDPPALFENETDRFEMKTELSLFLQELTATIEPLP